MSELKRRDLSKEGLLEARDLGGGLNVQMQSSVEYQSQNADVASCEGFRGSINRAVSVDRRSWRPSKSSPSHTRTLHRGT